jgi:hypothetical protein
MSDVHVFDKLREAGLKISHETSDRDYEREHVLAIIVTSPEPDEFRAVVSCRGENGDSLRGDMASWLEEVVSSTKRPAGLIYWRDAAAPDDHRKASWTGNLAMIKEALSSPDSP